MRFMIGLAFACAAVAATVQGVAIDNASGRLLASTKVALTAVGGSPAFSSETNREGSFVFSGVPAGAYLLSAERPAYIRARWGQKTWNGAGKRIALEAASHFAAEIRLSRSSAIQGTVADQNGVGVAGYTVTAFRAEKPIRPAASGQTDDRGVYRIPGLAPGRYYVRTAARHLADGVSLLPTFFGQGASLGQARVIDLGLEQEASGIEIQPVLGNLGRLSGAVRPAGSPVVKLLGDTGVVLEQPGRLGGFLFDQLTPGTYELFVEDGPLSAYRKIQLNGDLDGLDVELAPSQPIRFQFEESGGKPFDPAKIGVFALRKSPGEGDARKVWPGGASLPAGTWEINVVCESSMYVAAIRADGESGLAWNQIAVRPGRETSVTVSLSSGPGSVRGNVTSGGAAAAGAAVLLAADGADSKIAMRKAIAEGRGEFRFVGLPPGKYRLAAAADPDRMELDPAESVAVEVTENAEVVQDVEIP